MKQAKLNQRVTPAIITRLALQEMRNDMEREKNHEAALNFCKARANHQDAIKLRVVK